VEENYKPFYQEEGIIVIQAIIDNLFKEALGFRVSLQYGGHDTTEEELYSSPRWHEGHTKLVCEVHRTSRTYGGTACPTSLLDTIIRSTSIRSAVLRIWIYHHDGGGEKLARLEKRLVENVDFDDQALHILGFGTYIYYMLGHLGWVQFSNGVSANTHKEFSL
jgi:hypothetical protein